MSLANYFVLDDAAGQALSLAGCSPGDHSRGSVPHHVDSARVILPVTSALLFARSIENVSVLPVKSLFLNGPLKGL